MQRFSLVVREREATLNLCPRARAALVHLLEEFERREHVVARDGAALLHLLVHGGLLVLLRDCGAARSPQDVLSAAGHS